MIRGAILILCAGATAAVAAQQSNGPLVYVSNEIAETVSVIDGSNRVLRTIKVNGRPRGTDARGSRIYVAMSDLKREQGGRGRHRGARRCHGQGAHALRSGVRSRNVRADA
jgi:YVTN family beta-propeller protein